MNDGERFVAGLFLGGVGYGLLEAAKILSGLTSGEFSVIDYALLVRGSGYVLGALGVVLVLHAAVSMVRSRGEEEEEVPREYGVGENV